MEGPGSASSVRKEGQRPEQSSAGPPSKPWPSPELWDGRRATRQMSSSWQDGLCGVLRDRAGRAHRTLRRSTQATRSGAGGQLPARRADTLWSVQPPAPSLPAEQRRGGPSLEENAISRDPVIFMFIQRSASGTARDRTIRPKP